MWARVLYPLEIFGGRKLCLAVWMLSDYAENCSLVIGNWESSCAFMCLQTCQNAERKTFMQNIHFMLVGKLKIKWFRTDLVWTLYQTYGYLRMANTKHSDIGLLCSEVTVLLETEWHIALLSTWGGLLSFLVYSRL